MHSISGLSHAGGNLQDEHRPRSTLHHKESDYSTADTFASALSHEGDNTDKAGPSRESDSPSDSVPNTASTAGNHEVRATSQDTARWRQSFDTATRPNAPRIADEVTASSETPRSATQANDGPSEDDGPPEEDIAKTEEAGEQIEPLQPMGHIPVYRRAARHFAILSLISFAAIWGTLARRGLTALNTYDGQSVTPLVWAQAAGCLFMGLAIGGKNQRAIDSRYPPAYIMFTTGFCGSVTTFSGWILDVFRAFGDQRHFNRHGLHNVMDALTQTGVTLGMSLISVAAGMALANILSVDRAIRLVAGPPRKEDHQQHRKTHHPHSTLVLDMCMTVLGLVFWVGAAILCALYSPFRNVTFGLVMAPPGAILRWYLSRLNSGSWSKRCSIPAGTLAANLIATAVICAAFTSSRVGSTPRSFSGGITGCQALLGLEDGFCGCLSTVSTFAVELRNIKPVRKAVRYAVLSWVTGLVLCVLLMGAPWWAIGMDGRCLGLVNF